MSASSIDDLEEPIRTPSSPSYTTSALVPISHQSPLPESRPDWQLILQDSRSIVLYNPTSHALSIQPSLEKRSRVPSHSLYNCPYCRRPLDEDSEPAVDLHNEQGSRAADYFRLLEIANDTASTPSTPTFSSQSRQNGFRPEAMAEGYFNTFFQEECKLGMGANGSVFLCQHVLDGNPLGHFAIKKIAVGESHSYLLQTLREVKLLETLRHPNIITYHHAWLETCQFSAFGPKVPTLHVLMQWAEGGSLDDFIDARLGRRSHPAHDPTTPTAPESNDLSRSARIRAFRKSQADKTAGGLRGRKPSPQLTAIHLLSAEEVKSLFGDIIEGLHFLHDKSILHLDLKPGNVLLTWDDTRIIPRAMLSDFGTSRDMLHSSRRSGNTGTLEYVSPESLPSVQTGLLSSVDSKADMWSLGMILHRLLFFRLPYHNSTDSNSMPLGDSGEMGKMDRLESEVRNYAGFKYSTVQATAFTARRLPRSYLILLENLLTPISIKRPSCANILNAIRSGKFDPESAPLHPRMSPPTSLIPLPRRNSSPTTPRTPSTSKIEDLQTPITPAPPSLPPAPAERRKLKTPSPHRKRYYPNAAITRLVKSCILAAKVASLQPGLVRPPPLNPTYGLMTAGLAIVLAVYDTVQENVTLSVGLGVLHVLLLKLAYC